MDLGNSAGPYFRLVDRNSGKVLGGPCPRTFPDIVFLIERDFYGLDGEHLSSQAVFGVTRQTVHRRFDRISDIIGGMGRTYVRSPPST